MRARHAHYHISRQTPGMFSDPLDWRTGNWHDIKIDAVHGSYCLSDFSHRKRTRVDNVERACRWCFTCDAAQLGNVGRGACVKSGLAAVGERDAAAAIEYPLDKPPLAR